MPVILPTIDFSAGYKGTVDNTQTKVRESGETNQRKRCI